MERWAPIPGFPGYEVSDHGQVRSWWGKINKGRRRAAAPHLLVGRISGNRVKYRRVMLSLDDGRKLSLFVHRLVLMAFGPPRPSPAHVSRHLDGNPLNNVIGNLAWGTQAENMADRDAHGRGGQRMQNPNAKLTDPEIALIRVSYSAGLTQTVIASRFGISQSHVSKIVRGEAWR